ncbi:MAG: HAMP domain-containing histidine kinase [Cytophagales bacterium]|nr:HAMP domain-containing histidine kinase [Cytophaga sp.]
MIFYIRNSFLKKIKQASIQIGKSSSDYRRTLLFIQIIIVVCIGLFIASISDLYRNNYHSFYIDAFSFSGFSFSLFLMYKGRFQLSQTLALLLMNVGLLINGLREGPYAGNQFLFFPYTCSLFILFSGNDKKVLLFGFVIGIANILALEYFNYSLWLDTSLTEIDIQYNYSICIIFSALLMIVMLYYLISINKKIESKLNSVNTKLKTQNKILKKTNTELDSFVYKTSHDLRSPLTSVLGLLSLLKKEQSAEEAEKYLLLIEKSVVKLDTYILDVLSISRNARTEVSYKKISIQKILDDAFEAYSYIEEYAGIEKKTTIHQKAEFYSDDMRLVMIVNNLISNAYRYHNSLKEHQYIHVYVLITQSSMELVVSDNGIGIDNMHIEYIFNMFYRATNKNNGSGLGLYIVKEALEKLNGKISVKSVIREDTQITISIPNQINISSTTSIED